MAGTKLVILDYFFIDDKGHDGHHDCAIAVEALRQGISAEIWCPKSNVTEQPTFVKRILQFPGAGKKWILWHLFETVRRACELRTLLRSEGVDEKTIILVSSIDDYFSAALVMGTCWREVLPKIVLILRRGWNEDVKHANSVKEKIKKSINYPLMRFLHRRKNVVFFSDSELIIKEVIAGGFYDAKTLPIILQTAVIRTSIVEKKGLVIGYFGGARFDKGFDLMPEVITQVLRKHPHAFFIIQMYLHDWLHDAVMKQVRKEVFLLAKKYPKNVKIIDSPLTEAEYSAYMQQCTIVLLPYRPEYYRRGTSGILAEAIALGKKVVVPAGTWMSVQKNKYDLMVTFDAAQAPLLVTAIEECIVRGKQINEQKVQQQIAAWRLFHSAKAFVEIVLSVLPDGVKSRKITATIVARNEEKRILRCLESLRGLVDEIIFVHDGPCEDKTLKIAEKFTNNIFVRKYIGEAEPHRRFILEKATHNWILQIDADEYLTEGLAKKLSELIKNQAVSGYCFKWNIAFEGEEKFYDHKLALYRKDAIVQFFGIPHEIVKLKGKIVTLDNIELGHDRHKRGSVEFAHKSKVWPKVHAKYAVKYKYDKIPTLLLPVGYVLYPLGVLFFRLLRRQTRTIKEAQCDLIYESRFWHHVVRYTLKNRGWL